MPSIRLKDTLESKIMIRAANWVGDAIMTTPVIRAIRKNYPLSRITVLAKPWVIPVHAHSPYIDEIMVYENSTRHKKGLGTIRLSRDIRRQKFDLCVLMQNAFEAALITFLGGVKERLGYDTDARALLLNRVVKMNPELKKRHLTEYYTGILKGAGLRDDGQKMDLFLSAEDEKWASQFLAGEGVGTSDPIIGINPGATGGTAKRWFPERYAELAGQLSKRYGAKVLIFGGPSDRALGDQINEMSRNCCVNIAGRTTLGHAFALIDRLDLFVTNDSGLMHAAAALGTNQVAVIGSTDYIATSPLNENSTMVRVKTSCAPCLKGTCPTDHRCMDRISVEKVLESCGSYLDIQKEP